eukprot:SAG31_NODE_963_length_10710_cov_332.216285_2_plen_185_part_00
MIGMAVHTLPRPPQYPTAVSEAWLQRALSEMGSLSDALSTVELTLTNAAIGLAAALLVSTGCASMASWGRVRAARVAATRRHADGQATISAMRRELESVGANSAEWASIDVQTLAAQLCSGALPIMALLERIIRRAIDITGATNCITEFPFTFKELRDMSELLDKVPVSRRGLLHGLPVSLKVC